MLLALEHPGYGSFLKAHDLKERWIERSEEVQRSSLDRLGNEIGDPAMLAGIGIDAWNRSYYRTFKAFVAGPSAKDLAKVVKRILGFVSGPLILGAQFATALYVRFGLDLAQDAGTATLDQLGIEGDFRVTQALRDRFEAQGSKVLTRAYGNHVEELSRIVARAADPARALSVDEIADEIGQKWSLLTDRQARAIARTEVTRLWAYTQRRLIQKNGVEMVEWLSASGNPCPICLSLEASSPIPLSQLEVFPPLHVNCSCDLLPVLVSIEEPAFSL